MVASDAGRAYLDRLSLAVDVRLIDDVAKWPSLAARADKIVEHVRGTTKTRAKVFDELSPEERLLHAVAQALGGKLDDREARTIHDSKSYTDRDVPFVAIVLASRGIDTPRALDTYTLALSEPLSPPLAHSLHMAFMRGFPPAQANRLGPTVLAKLHEAMPDAKWSRVVRALGGDEDGLANLAIDEPIVVANAGSRVIDALLARPDRHERLVRKLPEGTPADAAVRLELVARAVAWRLPLPRDPIRQAIGKLQTDRAEPTLIAAATIAAIGAGDVETARRLCKYPAIADVETTAARTLAMLGGDAGEVRTLWSLVPEGDTTSPLVAANAALISLELGDRARLRELAVPLTTVRDTACGRVLLARVYLGAGQRELADNVLADDDSPVARLLKARSVAANDRASAIAQLDQLVEMFPGWAEARLRLGLVHAAVDPKRAIAVLQTDTMAWWPDSAALGPPETARAAARLAIGELHRRAGNEGEAARAIGEALARAPASPLVARQAAVLAVALRNRELAVDARKRLEAVTPGAKIVERLAGALYELAGDRTRAMASYRKAGSWDRVVVLAARAKELAPDARLEAALAAGIDARESGSFSLPPAFDIEDTANVAALHGAAISVQRTDPELTARALERALERRPDHRGMVDDLIMARVHCARAALASGDPTALMEAAQDLERVRKRAPDDARLRDAYALVGIAIAMRWIREGELETARARLKELYDQMGTPFLALHMLALATRALDVDAARKWLAVAPAGDYRELLEALLAELLGDADGVRARLPRLLAASGYVGSAARLLDVLHRGAPRDLAAWFFTNRDDIKRLGSDAAVWIAYALAGAPEDRPPFEKIAELLEELAASFDGDGTRRARLVALGLRATADPPQAVSLEAIDLGQLEQTAERDLAIGLIAFETRRRRAVKDTAGANAALDRLVQLVRPASAVGILARLSIEAAAEATFAAWRAAPDDFNALQTALATQLRRAIDRELTGRPAEACRTAWRTVVGLLGPVLVGDRAWRMLATRRAKVYTIAAHELAFARDACGRRIADILGSLTKWHAARGDAVQPAARFEEVRQLLASELAIARTLSSVMAEDDEVRGTIPLALGPLGIDLLGLRADAIEALAAVPSESAVATEAADVRGILVGALVEGWLALHDGRFDVAERIVRERVAAVGRIEPETTGLLAAVFVRRIREVMDENDLLAASDLAQGWCRVEKAHGMPETLAVDVIALCEKLFARYRIGRPRRLLHELRQNHDSQALREAEAKLIARHLDDLGGPASELEPIELCIAGVSLAPLDELRRQLRTRISAALAAARNGMEVDKVLTALRAAPDPLPVAESLVAAQLRRSELTDELLTTINGLDARIETLRQLLDLSRTAGLSAKGVAKQLATLHERLGAIYQRGGNDGEAARHDRRAVAYRNWS